MDSEKKHDNPPYLTESLRTKLEHRVSETQEMSRYHIWSPAHTQTLILYGQSANATVSLGIRFFLSVVLSFRQTAYRTKLHIILYQDRSIYQKTTEATKGRKNGWKGVTLQRKQTILRYSVRWAKNNLQTTQK